MSAVQTAERLRDIYRDEKVPTDRAFFASAGFTKEGVSRDPDRLFQMLVLAAYDRWPFTLWAGGYEPIWGLGPNESLPAVLSQQGIFTPREASPNDDAEVRTRLAGCRFVGHRVDCYGGTDFSLTITQTAASVGLLHQAMNDARTAADAKGFQQRIDDIHGFGPTIASKMVMYLMREMALGSVPASQFAPIAMPLLLEFHNARMRREIERSYGAAFINEVFDALNALGEPLAIDALFYISREKPDLTSELFPEISQRSG